jgi:L,D-transpeptidase ErfK/SrfK
MIINRRTVLVSGIALCTPLRAEAAFPDFNMFAKAQQDMVNVTVRQARTGDTWQSLFGEREVLARYANRQNVQLEVGQYYVVPTHATTIEDMCPLPVAVAAPSHHFVLVSPHDYAFALYIDGVRTRWGPVACGGSWCGDVGRSCRTPRGMFTITEVAGPKRRSSKYPVIEAAEGRGALMPYYMRLTNRGVGMHARYISGSHVTHGCIGMFYEDAKWLNQNIAAKHPVMVQVASY